MNVVRAETIEAALSDLEEKSKIVMYPARFTRFYPHSSLANNTTFKGGEARGTFEELERHIAIAIDPARSECITRRTGGLFVWSEYTIKSMNEMKGASGTLKERQIKLVTGMLSILISLLLDDDDNLAEGCFLEPFMGSAFSLLTSSRSQQ